MQAGGQAGRQAGGRVRCGWDRHEAMVVMAVVGGHCSGHSGGLDRIGWRWDGPAGCRRPM